MLKQPILSEVSEVRDGFAIIRRGDVTETYSLQWYRVLCVELSCIERRLDGEEAG